MTPTCNKEEGVRASIRRKSEDKGAQRGLRPPVDAFRARRRRQRRKTRQTRWRWKRKKGKRRYWGVEKRVRVTMSFEKGVVAVAGFPPSTSS